MAVTAYNENLADDYRRMRRQTFFIAAYANGMKDPSNTSEAKFMPIPILDDKSDTVYRNSAPPKMDENDLKWLLELDK